MLITRLELENIKSYKQVSITFQRGTTAISGANGAGKTTLVEAIGFALFNWMAYRQDQFVREGEKYGRVVVHLIGNDDRPYVVERRCGSGACWTLYDSEANYRLEQRADVMDKLHELFGVERERSLEKLFSDALGVPQGTFTSIFLQPTRIRKQTFDELLQIDDYHTAADYLLDTQRQYKDQLAEQEREMQRLSFETRELEHWRLALVDARQEDEAQKSRNLACLEQKAKQQAYATLLKERQAALAEHKTAWEKSQLVQRAAVQHAEQVDQALREAHLAHQLVEENRSAYESYRRVELTLAALRQEERQRNNLREQLGQLTNAHATAEAQCKHMLQRLEEIERERNVILTLLPEVERQSELEKQIEMLKIEAQQYEVLRKTGQDLYHKRELCREKQAVARQRVEAIEPLRSLSTLLQERVTRVAQLEVRNSQREALQKQLTEKRRLYQAKDSDLAATKERLHKTEEALRRIEEHRREGEEYGRLLKESHALALQQHHLQGNIESYRDSREHSLGGQCPLLHQTCLNIQQQGTASLETYFDDRLAEEQGQLDALNVQMARLDERTALVKKYADALEKVEQYNERRAGYIDQIEQLQSDLSRLEQEVQALSEEWEGLRQIEGEIAQARAEQAESQRADEQVRLLPGLLSEIEQLQVQIDLYTDDLEKRRREAEPLKQSKEQLQARQHDLEALGDPRTRSKAAQRVVLAEPMYREQLQQAEEQLSALTIQMNELHAKLASYATLDTALRDQEQALQHASSGYYLYLKNEQVAASLPERQRASEEGHQLLAQAEQDLARAEAAYQEADAAFDELEFQAVEEELRTLDQEIATLAVAMRNLQEQMNDYARKITATEALLLELEAAQHEKKTLEDLVAMTEQFRKLIKEAAPFVLKARLRDISAEANRIFGEIMGDRSAQLTWTDDYEINLLRQGNHRSFAQLSGGEQMSAALAVRLALLKKLSSINLAFFDEPTQNMDELRRTNLAEQIKRVRGFEQLLVISHDDTFEQGLDSLIRLHKQNGQTRQLSEEEFNESVLSVAAQVGASFV